MVYKSRKGKVFIAIYVNDCLCIRDDDAIKEVIDKIKDEGLKLKIENNLEDYLNCHIVFSKDKTKAWLGQPELIERIEKKFGRIVKNMKEYGTPGMLGMSISRIFGDDILLSSEE